MAARHFRAHQRFSIKLPVTLRSMTRGVSSKGSSVDVGVGGGAFELDTPLRLGEAVEVLLEGSQPLTIVGRVAWVGWAEASAVRLGVRFDANDSFELAVLLQTLGVTADVGT